MAKFDNEQEFLHLLSLLNDPNSSVQRRAAQVLGQLGDSRAIGPLVQLALTSTKRDVTHMCINSLGNIGNPDSIDQLEFIAQQRQDLLSLVISAFGWCQDTDLVRPYILDALTSPLQHVKMSGIEAATSLTIIEAKELIEPLLQASDPEIKTMAIHFFSTVGTVEDIVNLQAVEQFDRSSNERDELVADLAADAISQIIKRTSTTDTQT